MNRFNKKQLLYFSGMTISMILADIFVCISNEIIQKIGVGMLLLVAIFAILFYQETKMKNKVQEKEMLKKILK